MQLNLEASDIIHCWNSALHCHKLLFQSRSWNGQRGESVQAEA